MRSCVGGGRGRQDLRTREEGMLRVVGWRRGRRWVEVGREGEWERDFEGIVDVVFWVVGGRLRVCRKNKCLRVEVQERPERALMNAILRQ